MQVGLAVARWRAMRAGLTQGETETQSLLRTMEVAKAGENSSVTRELESELEKSRGAVLFPLSPPPRAGPQLSKEGCPALVNT